MSFSLQPGYGFQLLPLHIVLGLGQLLLLLLLLHDVSEHSFLSPHKQESLSLQPGYGLHLLLRPPHPPLPVLAHPDGHVEPDGVKLDGDKLDGVELDDEELNGVELDGVDLDSEYKHSNTQTQIQTFDSEGERLVVLKSFILHKDADDD